MAIAWRWGLPAAISVFMLLDTTFFEDPVFNGMIFPFLLVNAHSNARED
jgi:hypothetical protein